MTCDTKSIILLYELAVLFFFVQCVAAEDILLSVHVKKPIAVVSDKFLSVTLDPAVFFSGNALSDMERSKSMAKALAPAYVRIGGPHSNSYTFERSLYPKEINAETGYTFSESQWVNVQQWAQQSGLDVVAVLAPQRSKSEKVGVRASPWDPRNALDLISLSDHLGYNISWQLGYECQSRCDATGTELGRDVQRLRSMLNAFPRYSERGIYVVGPDVVDFRGRQQQQYLQDYFSAAGATLGAVTWHPDFAGVTVETEGVSMHHDDLALERDSLYRIAGRHIYRKPLWIAESKPEECKRQFLGALVWTRRLGNAAKLGIQVLMRQPDNSDLFRPTPDFWVSALHKMLVGQQVLETRMITGNRTNVHFYCQCTRPSSKYKKGSLTIFGVNLTPSRVSVNLKGLKLKAMHKYILMPGFDAPNRMFAETVLLNNEKLNLINGKKVPDLQPAISNTERGVKLKLSSGAIGFWVLPDLDIKVCMDEGNGDKNRESSGSNEGSVSEEDESKEVFDILSSAEEEQRTTRQHQLHRKRQSTHRSDTGRHKIDETEKRKSHRLGSQVHADPDHHDKVLHKRDHRAVSSRETDTGKVIEALTLITEVENAMKNLEKIDLSGEYRPSSSGLTSSTDDAFGGRLDSHDSDNDKLLSKVLDTEESRRTLIPSKIEDQLHALYELLSEERFSHKRSPSFRPRRNLIRDSEIDSPKPSENGITLLKSAGKDQNLENDLQREFDVGTQSMRVDQNLEYEKLYESQQDGSYIHQPLESDHSENETSLEKVEITNGPNYIQLLEQSNYTSPLEDVSTPIVNNLKDEDNSNKSTMNHGATTILSRGMNEPMNHSSGAKNYSSHENGSDTTVVGAHFSKSADNVQVEESVQHQTINRKMTSQEEPHKVDILRREPQHSYQLPTQLPQQNYQQQYQKSSYNSQPLPYTPPQPTHVVDSIPLQEETIKSNPGTTYRPIQRIAPRVKRHINSLEDIFHKEMVAQDDNNLRDCQCRVIRGQQECRDCNMLLCGIHSKPSAIPVRRGYKHPLINTHSTRMRFRRNVDQLDEGLSDTVTSETDPPEIQVEEIRQENFEGQKGVDHMADDIHPRYQIEPAEEQGEATEISLVNKPQDSIAAPSMTQVPEITIVDDISGRFALEEGDSEVTPSRLPRRTSPEVKSSRNRKQFTKSNDNSSHVSLDVDQNTTIQDKSISTDSSVTQPILEKNADINAVKEMKTSLPDNNVTVNSLKTVDRVEMSVNTEDSAKSNAPSSFKITNPESEGGQRFDLNNKSRNKVNAKDKHQKKNDKAASLKKPHSVDEPIKRDSKITNQNEKTESESLNGVKNQTGDIASKNEDSVKSRQVRLTTRAEALAALRKESEKRRTKKMIEASLRQLDTESARFAEYQKRRQDQIEKLKARLRAKREKMLQQYKQELLEAIEKSSDSEERSLRRRDLLQILKENLERDGLEHNAGKSTQILNHKPSDYETNRDVRESEREDTPMTNSGKSGTENNGEQTGMDEAPSHLFNDHTRIIKVPSTENVQVTKSSHEKRSLDIPQMSGRDDRRTYIISAGDVSGHASQNQEQTKQYPNYDTRDQSQTLQKVSEQDLNDSSALISIQAHGSEQQKHETPDSAGGLHLYRQLNLYDPAIMGTVSKYSQHGKTDHTEEFDKNLGRDGVPSIYYDMNNPKSKRSSTGALGINSYPFVGENEPDQNLQELFIEPSAQILARSYRHNSNQYSNRKKRETLHYRGEDIGGPLSFSLTLDESEMKSPDRTQYDTFVRRKRDTQDTYERRDEDPTEQRAESPHKSVKKSLHSSKKSLRISRRTRSVEKLAPNHDKPRSHIMFVGHPITSTLTAKINTLPTRTHLINLKDVHISPKKCKRSCQESMNNNLRSTENNEISRSADPDTDEILNDIMEMKENARLLEEFDERKTEVMRNFKNSQRNLQEYLQMTKNSSVNTQPETGSKSATSTTVADIESILVETIPKLQTVVTGELEKAKNLTGSLEDFLQTFDDQYDDTTEIPNNSSNTMADDGRISHYVFHSMVNGVNKIFGIVSKFAKILQAH